MTNLKVRNILISDLKLFLIKEPLVRKLRPVSYIRGFLIRGTYYIDSLRCNHGKADTKVCFLYIMLNNKMTDEGQFAFCVLVRGILTFQ